MTLAPSHQRRLNGNRGVLLLLLLLSFLFSSCELFKKVPREDGGTTRTGEELEEISGGERVYNPKTGQYEYQNTGGPQMDTIQWTVNPPTAAPPITSNGGVLIGGDKPETNPTGGGSQMRDRYRVAILLPFLTDRFDTGRGKPDPKSLLALNYYYGAKMAFDELAKEGIQLDINTFDTKASEAEVSRLLQSPEVSEADLILGPIRKSNLSATANFAKQNGITMVSPLSPSTDITADNPYFVQTTPSLVSHCEAITRHVLDRYRSDQVTLVARNKEAEIQRLKYFQDANYAIGGRNARSFDEFVVSDNTADFNEMDVTPQIREGDTTVFIVPSWSNESFIYSFLRKVKVAKGDNTVIIYGMPQWMDFQIISYDYYEELNVHVSSAYFVDNDATVAQEFRRRFFDRYGMVPTREAYAGFDQVRLLGRSLKRHGTLFQKQLGRESQNFLSTRYNFQPVVSRIGIATEDYSKVDRFENKYVNILRFKDYFFQLAQ